MVRKSVKFSPAGAIEELLYEKIGLDPATLGSDIIAIGVRERVEACSARSLAEYHQLLRESEVEVKNLIEAVVVPETWFFRDHEPFEYLKQFATKEWRSKSQNRILRVLSVPCSTGEEPYSIVMALIDAGLSTHEFKVDAVDISSAALARARRAIYGARSFRGKDLSYRDRYFEHVKPAWQLSERIRGAVNLIQGNILAPDFLVHESYDVIFCRNLLIYFNAAGWSTALKAISRLLNKTGVLFMGHAECLDLTAPQFESVRHQYAFAYRWRSGGAPKINVFAPLPKHNAVDLEILAPRPAPRPAPPRRSSKRVPTAVVELAQAQEAADQGDVKKAAEKCRKVLARNPASSEALLLLGVIENQARNYERAEDYFKKALYLNSSCEEALVYLALFAERRGDQVGASVMRKRAARIAAERERSA